MTRKKRIAQIREGLADRLAATRTAGTVHADEYAQLGRALLEVLALMELNLSPALQGAFIDGIEGSLEWELSE